MPSIVVAISNKRGLHARAAAKFVKTAEGFTSTIRVYKTGSEDVSAGGRSILSLMMLGADKGSSIHIHAEGDDADEALAALGLLVQENFGGEE